MPSLKERYLDLDINFKSHPITGDVAKNKDEYAIIGAMKNLFFTNFYERPFQPQIGSNIRRMLFEPMDGITSSAIKDDITNVIKNYEPRIDLKGVKVIPDYDKNRYDVEIVFFMVNDPEPLTINFFLERAR